MNRTLVVSLLRKSIEELSMITDGFMEMNVYPEAIIRLSQQKIDDIQDYIRQLAAISEENGIWPVIQEDLLSSLDMGDVDFEKEMNEVKEGQEEIVEAKKEIVEAKKEVVAVQEKNQTEKIPVSKDSVPPVPRSLIDKKFVDDSIATALSNKKISDIKQAISIGDRFRFQRELFNGNGEVMSRTLSKINQCANLDEALKYLTSKFKWNKENETVADFHQLLKRRF
jgi:hypothetical protein